MGEIAVGAALCGRTLALKDAEIIAVEGLWCGAFAGRIAGGLRLGEHGAKRALRLARLDGPIEAILLAGRTHETLGIVEDAVATIDGGIFALGVHKGLAGLDGDQLIAP